MISRSTLVGALVVTELVILGAAGQAIGGGGPAYASGPTPGTHTHFGIVFENDRHRHEAHAVTSTLDRTFAAGLTPHVVVDVSDVPVTVQAGSLPAVHVVGTVRKSGFKRRRGRRDRRRADRRRRARHREATPATCTAPSSARCG